MDLYQQQQFDFFLYTATDRFVMRLEERFRGADGALEKLQQDPQGEGVWLDQFVDAVLEDFLLNNLPGACFLLQAMSRRTVETVSGGTVETTLMTMARQLFADLLLQKTTETLEQHSGYQSV